MSMTSSINQLWDLETTTNAWTEIASFDIDVSNTIHVRADMWGWDASGDAYMAVLRGMARRDTGSLGPLFSFVYELLNVQKTIGALLWDSRVRLDGTTVRVEVKGRSGSVFWNADGLIRGMQDDSYLP